MDYQWWWEQEGIDLEGEKETLGSAEAELEEETEEWGGGFGGGNGDRGRKLIQMGEIIT